MSEFKREDRYIVIKRTDMTDCLSKEETDQLLDIVGKLEHHRLQLGKQPVIECVVVESDWPEYEPVWRMIEERMVGDKFTQSLTVKLTQAVEGRVVGDELLKEVTRIAQEEFNRVFGMESEARDILKIVGAPGMPPVGE